MDENPCKAILKQYLKRMSDNNDDKEDSDDENSDENAEDDVDCSLPPDCFSQPSPTCLIRKFDMSCSLTNNSSPVPNSFSRINTNTVIQFLKHMQINSQKFMSTQIS